jgi:hypothetical protein
MIRKLPCWTVIMWGQTGNAPNGITMAFNTLILIKPRSENCMQPLPSLWTKDERKNSGHRIESLNSQDSFVLKRRPASLDNFEFAHII